MVREIHRLQSRALLVAAALCMALPGCGGEEPVFGAQNNPPMETLSTGQIVAVITTINQGESKQVQLVIDRLDDADVKAYAQKLLIEHRDAETELTKLAATLQAQEQSSDLQGEVEKLGKKMNGLLLKEKAERLGPLFLDVQLLMHREALRTVDRLLVQAQEPELKAYLENLRKSMEEDQREAGKLREKFPETTFPT